MILQYVKIFEALAMILPLERFMVENLHMEKYAYLMYFLQLLLFSELHFSFQENGDNLFLFIL